MIHSKLPARGLVLAAALTAGIALTPTAITSKEAHAAAPTALADGPCPADINGSGDVEFGDLLEVFANWGPCGACPQDINGNGTVGFGDAIEVVLSWGAVFMTGNAVDLAVSNCVNEVSIERDSTQRSQELRRGPQTGAIS